MKAIGEIKLRDIIEILEREIADRERALALLKAICGDALKGTRGAPRKYGDIAVARVTSMIAQGQTHRAIAASLDMPLASVGNIAKRMGVRRRKGDLRGGVRTKGQVNRHRRHVALKRKG
jgi:hypothetical protein